MIPSILAAKGCWRQLVDNLITVLDHISSQDYGHYGDLSRRENRELLSEKKMTTFMG